MTADMQITGDQADDYLRAVPSSGVTVCGFPLAPPIQNGYHISYFGSGGADQITGGIGPGALYSELADDSYETDRNGLYSYDPSALFIGANGSDVIVDFATPAGLYMFGESGNDTMGMPKRGFFQFVDGGGGTDTFCGPANSGYITSIEAQSSFCNGL